MDEVKLAILEDPKTSIETISATLDALPEIDEVPALRIDLTDPPVPPVAIVRGIEAPGVNADAAIKALAAAVAEKIRAADAEAKRAAAEIAATEALVTGVADAIAAIGAG